MKILAKISIITFLFASYSNVFAQTDTLSTYAIYLTLRSQEGVHLDSSLAWEYQHALEAAYIVNDSMRNIHVFPDYVLKEIYVITEAEWTAVWDSGGIWTGDPYIDSLGNEFGLESVDIGSFAYYLNFNSIFSSRRLGQLYEDHPDILYGRPNYYCCDGNNIEGFQKYDSTYLAFSKGWGDCMAGCMSRYYWYIQIDQNGNGELIGKQALGNTPPTLYIWNIPPRYAATMFNTVEEIFNSALNSPDWWVRRHSAEIMWRLITRDGPMGGEDDLQAWLQLKDGMIDSLTQAISILEYLVENDIDSDVVESAQYALERIENYSLKIIDEVKIPQKFKLFQPYPNPFNPTTTIRFNISVEMQHATSLQIYDLTGRLVETLNDGTLPAGEHEIKWNAGQLPSGVYFVRLQSGEFVENQKMLLMK